MYVYGFCVRLCKAFLHVVGYFCMYTDYLLSKMCGFCVDIQLFCYLRSFSYVYSLYVAMFDAESLDGSDLSVSLISVVCANVCDLWTVSRIQS